MKNWIFLMTLLFMFTLTACTERVSPSLSDDAKPQQEATVQEEAPAIDEQASAPVETRVKITMNDTVVYGTINNNVTAQAFLQQLPFHITGSRAASDICCAVSDELPFDPALQEAWNIGEIGWFRGWFTILCDHEEQFTQANYTIIGKIDDEYIEAVNSLSGSIDITVELDPQDDMSELEQSATVSPNRSGEEEQEKAEAAQMKVTIGENSFIADLSDNSSADALVELLKNGPLTIDMHDYGNFEKVGPIGQTLPRNDERITTSPGDIILYQGNQLTIYYDTNTWEFTSIGHIPDVTTEELLAVLGEGNVTVQFSLNEE